MRPGGEEQEAVPCQGGCDIMRHRWHRKSPVESSCALWAWLGLRIQLFG